jgi:ABC-type microcin C transport system duplicated ATPase subunit YejF
VDQADEGRGKTYRCWKSRNELDEQCPKGAESGEMHVEEVVGEDLQVAQREADQDRPEEMSEDLKGSNMGHNGRLLRLESVRERQIGN